MTKQFILFFILVVSHAYVFGAAERQSQKMPTLDDCRTLEMAKWMLCNIDKEIPNSSSLSQFEDYASGYIRTLKTDMLKAAKAHQVISPDDLNGDFESLKPSALKIKTNFKNESSNEALRGDEFRAFEVLQTVRLVSIASGYFSHSYAKMSAKIKRGGNAADNKVELKAKIWKNFFDFVRVLEKEVEGVLPPHLIAEAQGKVKGHRMQAHEDDGRAEGEQADPDEGKNE